MMIFDFLLFTAALAAGLIAAISGFGIGSVLTPLVSTHIDTKLAVAVVSIPHFIGTFLRLLRLRKHVDRSLALTFGAASAVGGLGGALLNAYANGPILGYVLGALLVFAGLSGMTGFAEQIELKGPWKWIGGFASAGFGGLVGNQGGIRSAAMLGFDLSKESFVATATVIALVVDGARMPVYFVTEHEGIISAWQIVLTATVGVVAGTFAGSSLLDRIAERTFKRVVSVLVFGLGIFMLLRPACAIADLASHSRICRREAIETAYPSAVKTGYETVHTGMLKCRTPGHDMLPVRAFGHFILPTHSAIGGAAY